MPPRMRLRLLLRSLAKLLAVTVVAGAAGVGLGVGLSQLTGDDSTSSSADTSSLGSDVSAATSTGGDSPTTIDPDTTAGSSTQAQTTSRQRTAGPVRVRVVASVLHRASTPTGRRSNRARLSVHVRVTNRGKRTIADAEPALVAGKRVRADPSAGKTGRSLLRPIRPGSTADGTLRFETAGAVTARLVRARRARLRIAGRTATLKVRIGRPVRSAR